MTVEEVMTSVLPNRKAFADSVTRTLLKYRKIVSDAEDADVDLCAGVGGTNIRELLPHQKVVRDYLLMETPYRGLLLYHGLGSGKTCSSIAVAESLLSTKKVYVMLPASLEQNYRGELRKCGDPLYMYDQHWRQQQLTAETRQQAKGLGISDGFLDRNRTFFTTIQGEAPNYQTLPKPAQDIIAKQIEDIIDQRFTFIRYNGLSSANIGKYVPSDGSNPYSNSVVIIDEVHNFISRISNQSDIARKLYDLIYEAVDCKVVALSGTPIINRPNEVAYLMNLLRGPIQRIIIPVLAIPAWDEERMATALRGIPDIDTIEFNTLKKLILVTRNPPHFRSIYSEKGERTAVQYVKDLKWIPQASDWVKSWAPKFQTDVGGAELGVDRVSVEYFSCLPTNYDEFASLFVDNLTIKNPLMFQRRIQGLVSYFKGADERMLPRRIDDDKMLEQVPMSDEQFEHYLNIRTKEVKQEMKKKRDIMRDDDDENKSFRINSRLACDYAVPPEFQAVDVEAMDEVVVPDKSEILKGLKAAPDRYLSERALETFSPKMLRIMQNINESRGEGTYRNQLLYSFFRNLEGLGVFSAALEVNGWQQYKLIKEAGQWVEDPALDAEKPSFAFYTGTENEEERELMRQIFNGVGFSDNFPPSLRASVESKPKKKLCLFMITAAGAEGITLANVRHVHIMEPHWNPARHDQVIGRAIRLCSHAKLPVEERTVRVSFYLSVFTRDQIVSSNNPNIVLVRKNDQGPRYGDDEKGFITFISTDEHIYAKAHEKGVINQKFGHLLKQAAIDCEIHRKLHSREKPVISCMRFDSTVTGEDLAFKPNIKEDVLDSTYLRNLQRRKRRLQKVSVKGMVFLIDPDTKEVFDGPAFDDEKRLMRMGQLTTPTQIRWVPDLQLA